MKKYTIEELMKFRTIVGTQSWNKPYFIDEDGNVYNSKLKKLKPYLNIAGYYRVDLRNDGERYQWFIHKMMGNTFIKRCVYNELEVDHIDRDRTNNKLSNLRVVTKKENLENRVFKKGK